MKIENHTYSSKILQLKELIFLCNSWKIKGANVGFTNGCFDILHKGHLTYLENASRQCSRLIVGVNSDSSVKRQGKGKNRPVNNAYDRAYALSCLGFVDAVILFDEDTPFEIIKTLIPNVLFKGGDYDVNANLGDKKHIVGSEIVKNNGGKIIAIPFVDGYSTTSIIQKINEQ